MTHLKFFFLACAMLLCTNAFAQVTFEKDFATFLDLWATKAAQYADHATKMTYVFFVGGLLTLASATMPLTDRKILKVIAFLLAIAGAGMTQYLGAFQVDPKMISKKTKIMMIRVNDFESKLKAANLIDPNIAQQYMLEKRQLEVELKKLDRQILGIDEELAFLQLDVSTQPQVASISLRQSFSDCARLILNPQNGEFQINGKRTELPGSLTSRMKQDTMNLYVAGAGYSTDINEAIAMTDTCITNSVRKFMSSITKKSNKNEAVFVSGIMKLSDVVYTSYQKIDNGGYQVLKIVTIPRSTTIGYYSDLYGNYDKASYQENKPALKRIMDRKVIQQQE